MIDNSSITDLFKLLKKQNDLPEDERINIEKKNVSTFSTLTEYMNYINSIKKNLIEFNDIKLQIQNLTNVSLQLLENDKKEITDELNLTKNIYNECEKITNFYNRLIDEINQEMKKNYSKEKMNSLKYITEDQIKYYMNKVNKTTNRIDMKKLKIIIDALETRPNYTYITNKIPTFEKEFSRIIISKSKMEINELKNEFNIRHKKFGMEYIKSLPNFVILHMSNYEKKTNFPYILITFLIDKWNQSLSSGHFIYYQNMLSEMSMHYMGFYDLDEDITKLVYLINEFEKLYDKIINLN